MRALQIVSLSLLASAAFAASLPVPASEREVEGTYVATLDEIPAGLERISVWIPLPSSGRDQTVDAIRIESRWTWREVEEKTFGNRYLHAEIENPPRTIEVRVPFRASRRAVSFADLAAEGGALDEAGRYLEADRLVTLSDRVRSLAADVTEGKSGTVEKARAIYDHVLATMRYDKTIPGWGEGDTERACDIRAGNCTDFHSLFLSLARAEGIPTRFVIGFPLPAEDSGTVSGYHCWAEFWVEGKGWVPVDASDAWKSTDSGMKAFLFGNLPADRVQFTIGRDLILSPATAEPLNYFIYPYGEANAQRVGVPSIRLEVAPPTRMVVGSRTSAGS